MSNLSGIDAQNKAKFAKSRWYISIKKFTFRLWEISLKNLGILKQTFEKQIFGTANEIRFFLSLSEQMISNLIKAQLFVKFLLLTSLFRCV